jgi:hypothetical protein
LSYCCTYGLTELVPEIALMFTVIGRPRGWDPFDIWFCEGTHP